MRPQQVLGFGQRSLGYLLQRYCGIQADKSLGQRADWRQRCGPSMRGSLADICMSSFIGFVILPPFLGAH